MSSISKINQYNYPNNNIGNGYLNMNLNNLKTDFINKDIKDNDTQDLKIDDLKIIEIDTELDYLYEIVYKTYKKEFTKDKSFSIESDEDIYDEIDLLVNEFEDRMKLRNQNLTDSMLSEILDDIGIHIN